MPRVGNRSGRGRGRPMGSKNRKKGANVWKSLVPKAYLPHYHVRRVSAAQELIDNIDLNNADSQLFKAYDASLSMVNNSGELIALYDQYRVTAVKYQFIWTLGATSINTSGIYAPCLTYYYDKDDAVTPNDGEFRDRSTTKTIKLSPNRVHTVVDRRPAVSAEIYNSPISTGFSVRTSPKMDMTSNAVPHYGLKINIAKAPIQLGTLQVRKTLYVTCYAAR